jgi:CspA family cold shock protein
MNEQINERMKGHIKWFNQQKRYGFIRRDDGISDVFVHRNEFRAGTDVYWLKEGDPVEFSVEQTPKGPSAVDVILLDAS